MEIGKHSLLLTPSFSKTGIFFVLFLSDTVGRDIFLLRICKSQYFSTHHPIEIKQLKEYAVWADGATEVAVLINSRGTGGYSISLRHTGLFFLKFWTLLLAANRKLPDEPSSHAGAFRGCRVMARF